MRRLLSGAGAVYSSDRAFYAGLLVAWELFGVLMELTARLGGAPAAIFR
ncbi:MAG TPA: hypothetical protein VK009_07580 [Chloroflexota bacterium]|nr:hypothetical protein [Chloroflexota bacterium]